MLQRKATIIFPSFIFQYNFLYFVFYVSIVLPNQKHLFLFQISVIFFCLFGDRHFNEHFYGTKINNNFVCIYVYTFFFVVVMKYPKNGNCVYENLLAGVGHTQSSPSGIGFQVGNYTNNIKYKRK